MKAVSGVPAANDWPFSNAGILITLERRVVQLIKNGHCYMIYTFGV